MIGGGMSHRGMFRRKGGIPVPEAGVCTPYPIPIPYTTGLLSYGSVFNSCDNYQVNDGTSPITADAQSVAYVNDLSGNSNPILCETTPPSIGRPFIYKDDGAGDVYWRGDTNPPYSPWTVDPSWLLNSTVKTVIMLIKSDLSNTGAFVTNRGTTNRLWVNIETDGRLRLRDDSTLFTTAKVSANTWTVISIRMNNNCILGINKVYETVKATAPTTSDGVFRLFAANQNVNRWINDAREIAIYSGSLSDSDVDKMVDYMKAKWNLI